VIAATIVGSDRVDYTFDQKIALASGNASNAILYTASASAVRGVSDALTNPTTLRVTFPASVAGIVEQFTYAAVGGAPIYGAAVVTSVKGVANSASGAPLGGNVGALADGFTSGPDARSATFDNGADTVTVDFDQRIDPSLLNPEHFVLRAKDGVSLGAPAATRVVQNPLIPGDARVVLDYTPGTVKLASILEIQGPPNSTTSPLAPVTAAPSAVRTFAGPGLPPIPNIQQILAASARVDQ
jgi:hypothetical protein